MFHPHPLLLCFLGILYSLLTAGPAIAQTTWYVDDDAPGDPGPGDPTVSDPNEDGSAAHPFDAIQEGIDVAVDGDEVVLARGHYTGAGNKNLTLDDKRITVRRASADALCTINCEWNGLAFLLFSRAFEGLVIDGLIIAHANDPLGRGAIDCTLDLSEARDALPVANSRNVRNPARGSGPTISNCRIVGCLGPAVRTSDASPLIVGCTLRNNSGPAISCTGGRPVISACSVSENVTDPYPAAIFCEESDATILDTSVAWNIGAWGAGVAAWGGHIRVQDCRIDYNMSPLFAGGLATESTDVTINQCRFSWNIGGYAGDGGVTCLYGTAEIGNCVIVDNVGGGFKAYDNDPVVVNCTISGNVSEAGGISFSRGDLSVVNSIIWENSAPHAPEAPQIAIFNSYYDPQATLTASYTDIQRGADGVYADAGCTINWGNGNIDVLPQFGNPASGYWLTPGSPCIDAGDNNGVPPDVLDLDGDGNVEEPTPFDVEGESRFVDDSGMRDIGSGTPPIVDIGAYEFQEDTCFADLDGDRTVAMPDVELLLLNYGKTTGVVYSDGDLDRDGQVDLADLAALLGVYGTECEWETGASMGL